MEYSLVQIAQGAGVFFVAVGAGLYGIKKNGYLTFGKPSARMIDSALADAGLAYEDAVMIGDRLYTDIKMGDLGLTSVLVLTGETDLEEGLNSPTEADIICDSIKDLLEIL